MTIFGVPWSELGIAHVQAFLDEADDEPLLWEAKGTELDKNEVRRQVCGFANSHEGGYLILGAAEREDNWSLSGLEFPDEPPTWVSQILGDPERGVRPRPDFDVTAWPVATGHVAVVRIAAISTPPCIVNGTIYERVPGSTQTVRDPLRLADLFSRGDAARKDAQARADRAAGMLMDGLEGDAGAFRRQSTSAEREAATTDEELPHVRYSIGIAATGNAPDISGRLFRDEFAEEVWLELRDRPNGFPAGFGTPPDPVDWAQDSLTWRHRVSGIIDAITIARASWDGSTAVGQKLAVEDADLDSLAQRRLAEGWRLANQLVERLGGFGDMYITVRVAGGPFARRRNPAEIRMRRGPLLPGVDDERVNSLSRELRRAFGFHDPEP